MFKILKGQQEYHQGIVICNERKNASSLSFTVHFLGTAVETNKKISLISSQFTEMNYKLIFSKAGIRWNPTNITFSEVIQSGYKFDTKASTIMDNVFERIVASAPEFVVFDDLSIFEGLGATEIEISLFVHKIYSFLTSVHEAPLLFAPFSSSPRTISLLKPYSNMHIDINPIGHGFSKDSSSKAILTSRSLTKSTKKAILISGERTNNGQWVSI